MESIPRHPPLTPDPPAAIFTEAASKTTGEAGDANWPVAGDVASKKPNRRIPRTAEKRNISGKTLTSSLIRLEDTASELPLA
jgi:hypothetical protein